MLKKLQLRQVGKIDLVHLILGLSVFFYNLLDQIIKGQDLIERMGYTVPYLIIAFVLFYLRSKYLRAILYLLLSCYITIDATHSGDFSGAIFFIFSFAQIKNIKYGISIIAITLISVTLRSNLNGDTVGGNILVMIVYMAVYAIYWFTIYSPTKSPNIPELDSYENKLLEILASGKSQKEAGAEMGETQSHISEMVKRIRRKTGCESLYQVLYLYGSKTRD